MKRYAHWLIYFAIKIPLMVYLIIDNGGSLIL
jgi:hypothetical protein